MEYTLGKDMTLPNLLIRYITRITLFIYISFVFAGKVPIINCNKAMSAGMTLRPPVQTIIDTVRYVCGTFGCVVECRLYSVLTFFFVSPICRYFIENRCLELPIESRPVSCSVM